MLQWRNALSPKAFRYVSKTSNADEYTSTPQYPPILDLSYEKKLERKKASKHEQISAVKTVEEKQIKLNMPRYYGFKTYMFVENLIPYNNLQIAQHITRTHIIENSSLPNYYEQINLLNTSLVKDAIEDLIIFETESFRRSHNLKKEKLKADEIENLVGSAISKQLNRILINSLVKDQKQLINTQVDHDPRIESCWYAGGMNPPERVKSYRRGLEWTKYRENEPTDRAICYIGSPYLTLRSELPLRSVIPLTECENPAYEVPYYKLDPRTVGIKTEYRRIVNAPGFWPGDPHSFGIMQYLRKGHLLTRHFDKDPRYRKEALHRQGILASFAWLNAQANLLGFTTFNDTTYPLVTQTVITDGQLFSFYTYQLNTLLIHSKNTSENPKKNICWATPELKLYERIEDGKLVGFNDEVVNILVRYYCNAPKDRLGLNLRPYLSTTEKIAADYEDTEKREWLEREYKFIVSNRPRQHLGYELYNWEKIYKVDHKTRPMEPRRRPFELRQNPMARNYDDRKPKYIPRALRPDLPRHKGRNANEYFP